MNLVAAFLTLLAIAFYVVVYTIMLKRTTPQNIVIGGAAGALPPVIGWAAVTGNVDPPALLLFALVFYWTPPHFWALSLRIRKDYAAAGVPMLPVVKGIPETTRQIGALTILLVAISLVLWAVAGWAGVPGRGRHLGGDVPVAGLPAVAARHVRGGVDRRAIRLYRYSISYLTLLFAAVAVDALVLAAIGRRRRALVLRRSGARRGATRIGWIQGIRISRARRSARRCTNFCRIPEVPSCPAGSLRRA